MDKNCIQCGKPLTGRQTKFCSAYCKNRVHGNNYSRQKERGKRLKLQLIASKGGGCQKCGYNKCIAALLFHHRDPLTKCFNVNQRDLANRTEASIQAEALKCDLLCANCHMEEHHLD